MDCWPKELVDVSTRGKHAVIAIPDEVVDALLGKNGRFVVAASSFGNRYANVDRSDFDDDEGYENEDEPPFEDPNDPAANGQQ